MCVIRQKNEERHIHVGYRLAACVYRSERRSRVVIRGSLAIVTPLRKIRVSCLGFKGSRSSHKGTATGIRCWIAATSLIWRSAGFSCVHGRGGPMSGNINNEHLACSNTNEIRVQGNVA